MAALKQSIVGRVTSIARFNGSQKENELFTDKGYASNNRIYFLRDINQTQHKEKNQSLAPKYKITNGQVFAVYFSVFLEF